MISMIKYDAFTIYYNISLRVWFPSNNWTTSCSKNNMTCAVYIKFIHTAVGILLGLSIWKVD